MPMRPLAAAGLLLALLRGPAIAQDYAALVAHGDRSDNPLILELLRTADLSTSMVIAEALGRRPDPYIADLLVRLGEDASGRQDLHRELQVRLLLARVLSADLPDLRERLEPNAAGLSRLASAASDLSPCLQREILRLLAVMPEAADRGFLMAQGMSLGELLRRQGGQLDAEQASLLRAYLRAAAALGDPDFAPVALMILQRTRDASVASEARRTARSLLSTGSSP